MRARQGERKAGKAKGFSLKALRIRLKLTKGYSSARLCSAHRLRGCGMAPDLTQRAWMSSGSAGPVSLQNPAALVFSIAAMAAIALTSPVKRHFGLSRHDRAARSPRR